MRIAVPEKVGAERVNMFELDFKTRKSIYEQVIDNLKERILVGIMRADEKLPSVRELSKRLTINPNTVQKAFRELERQGYIYTVSGLGSFVRARDDIRPDERLISEVKSKLAENIRELRFLVPDRTVAQEMIDAIFDQCCAGDLRNEDPNDESPNDGRSAKDEPARS